jgi:light-regulated signal transduction histidine kinase (bacteriophytochrome)
MFPFPRTRRAYLRSVLAGAGAFLFVVLIVHGLLMSLGMRAEATYLDDALVGIAVMLLVLALEARYEADLRAERERALLSLGLNHHIRNALQTIVYVSSATSDAQQGKMLADAARRIEWAVREVPKHAQAIEEPSEITAEEWKAASDNTTQAQRPARAKRQL